MASLMSILQQAGFKGDGLKMAYAIAMAESGGNAKAHNPNANTGDNSYGLFQINMLGAMGPARLKQYGLSSNSALFDALTNAKVAYKMSNGGKNWGPWSTYGNGAYKKYYGGSGASLKGNSGGSGGSSGGGSETKTMSREETAESYGFMVELFESVPELKALFSKATKAGWTPSKFQAELRDTKWWKKTSDSTRKWLTLQYGDPATAKQQLDQMSVKITQMGKAMGLQLDSKGYRALALKSIMGGWDDGMIRYNLGKSIVFKGGQRTGEAGEFIDKIEEYAYNMGITLGSPWIEARARNVVRGVSTQQDIESEIRVMAKSMFPGWAKQLDAGQTVADIASPYFSSMAQILELPPGSINLFDKTIKKALQSKDPTTGANAVQPLWQFENALRADDRWKGTQNAQNSMMQVAHQVLADFGVKS
jgi:hypothetical protein